jgi:hypothetical protein
MRYPVPVMGNKQFLIIMIYYNTTCVRTRFLGNSLPISWVQWGTGTVATESENKTGIFIKFCS